MIRGNQVYDNSRLGDGPGLNISSGSGNLVYNNVIWGNQKGIDVAWRNPVGTKIYNNTIYGNGGAGVFIGSDSTGAIVKNNLLYQNASAIINSGVSSLLAHNLTVDPKFVDANAKNFRLQASSPAIDAGIALVEVGIDIEGLNRPQGISTDWELTNTSHSKPQDLLPQTCG